MKIQSLKSALKVWQEIVFLIVFGWLLIYDALNASVIFQYTGGIVLSCIFLALFICLLVQFFWKNKNFGLSLSTILGAGSVFMLLGWLIDFKDLQSLHLIALSFCLFSGLTVTAVSMFRKYIKQQ